MLLSRWRRLSSARSARTALTLTSLPFLTSLLLPLLVVLLLCSLLLLLLLLGSAASLLRPSLAIAASCNSTAIPLSPVLPAAADDGSR